MKHYHLLLAFAAALFATGCSETVGTNGGGTNSTSHVLLVNPDTNLLNVYEQYTFKARVTNVAASELRFEWDFGGKTYTYILDENATRVVNTYNDTGNYTIHVRALDYFTDTLVAEKSIAVHVGLPPRDVVLQPRPGDTLIKPFLNGTYLMRPAINFYATSQLAANTITVKWHIADGSNDTVITGSSALLHYFPHFGIYFVRADIYDKFGNLWGSDSETINILTPTVSLPSLTSMRKVTVVLYLDQSVYFYSELPYGGFMLGLPMVNDSVHSTSWNSSSLIMHMDQLFATSRITCDLALRLSPDLKTLDALSLSFRDSIARSYPDFVQYGFNLKNVRLFGANDSTVVYAVNDTPLEDFSSDLLYSATNEQAMPYGDPLMFNWYYPVTKYPSAIVMFSK